MLIRLRSDISQLPSYYQIGAPPNKRNISRYGLNAITLIRHNAKRLIGVNANRLKGQVALWPVG